MSIIRSIKHRLGLSVTPANNFTFDASADNGTMKLVRESGQDIMTVDAAGKVAFSVGVFGFSFGTSGSYGRYIKFPSWLGGFCVQANTVSATLDTNGEATITLPTAFANSTYAVVVSNSNASVGPSRIYSTYAKGTTTFKVASVLSTTGAPTASTATEVSYIVFGTGA